MAWNNLTDAEAAFNVLRENLANLANSTRYMTAQVNNHILNTGMDGYTGPISPTVKPAPLDFIQGPQGIQGPPGPQGIQGVPGTFAEPWFDIDLISQTSPAANEIVLTYANTSNSPLIIRDFIALGIACAEGNLAIAGNIIEGTGSSLNITSNTDIHCYGYANLSADNSQIIVYIYGLDTNLTYQSEPFSYALRGVQGPQGNPGLAPYILNDTWWYYDETNTPVDSGVPATGPQGETGAYYTPDVSYNPATPGQFTMTWTAKDLNTIGPITIATVHGEQGIQGEKGEKGDKGDTAERFIPSLSYTYTPTRNTEVTVTYTGELTGDSKTFTYTVLRGEKGDKGAFYQPVPVVNGTSLILGWQPSEVGMTPINTVTITAPQGIQGEKGDQGDVGPQGPQGENLDIINAGANIQIDLSGDTPPHKIISAPQVTTNTQGIAAINDILKDRDKWGGVAGITYTPATNTLTLLNKDGTSNGVALPEVTVTYSGLMTSSDYSELHTLYDRVQSLEEGGVWRGTYATYAALIAAYPGLDVSSTTWTVKDFVYIEADETHPNASGAGQQTAYTVGGTNGGTRTLAFTRIVTTPIATATNTSLGVVQGTATGAGKVYVETAGTMSVNGWDALNNTIGTLTGELGNKLDKPSGFPGSANQVILGNGTLSTAVSRTDTTTSSSSPSSFTAIDSVSSDNLGRVTAANLKTVTLAQPDWNQTTTTSADYIKNKPTIPTVNNGTLTLQANGTNIQTFTANQSTNATANFAIPTTLTRTDTTSTASPGSAGTFTAVDSVTTNSYGQVSALNLKTVTMPTVNNASLALQVNGATQTTFTANDSTGRTFNVSASNINASLTEDTGTGTDVTTPAVASSTIATIFQTIWGKIRQVANLANSKYTKPSTGIPATDIASGVIPTGVTQVANLGSTTGANSITGASIGVTGTLPIANGGTGASNALTAALNITQGGSTDGWPDLNNSNYYSNNYDGLAYLNTNLPSGMSTGWYYLRNCVLRYTNDSTNNVYTSQEISGPMLTNPSASPYIYKRTRNNGAWGSWMLLNPGGGTPGTLAWDCVGTNTASSGWGTQLGSLVAPATGSGYAVVEIEYTTGYNSATGGNLGYSAKCYAVVRSNGGTISVPYSEQIVQTSYATSVNPVGYIISGTTITFYMQAFALTSGISIRARVRANVIGFSNQMINLGTNTFTWLASSPGTIVAFPISRNYVISSTTPNVTFMNATSFTLSNSSYYVLDNIIFFHLTVTPSVAAAAGSPMFTIYINLNSGPARNILGLQCTELRYYNTQLTAQPAVANVLGYQLSSGTANIATIYTNNAVTTGTTFKIDGCLYLQ